jgi:hypothetical protein
MLSEDEVRLLDGAVLQLHHDLPTATPCAAGSPVVLLAVCACVVAEASVVMSGGLLYAVKTVAVESHGMASDFR